MALIRDKKNALIGGVCAGLGKWAGIDKTIIRLAFLLAFIFAGAGPLLYLILWILIPSEE